MLIMRQSQGVPNIARGVGLNLDQSRGNVLGVRRRTIGKSPFFCLLFVCLFWFVVNLLFGRL